MNPPREIGPFEVLDKLGAGGMGEVFKARDRRLNRFVALKFLPEAASDAARERFQREALAIAALNHPHICTLYEVGVDGHSGARPYLVLELLEGETLKARLARGPLEAEQLLDWSVQITDALDAAHRKGVLHRDLKPENIWITPGGHVKVLDFGLARLEGEAAEAGGSAATVLTSPGVAMGTVPYMSPEQARGHALDARSDVFSFGSVFYEMASGRPAFPAANAADSVAAVLRGQPKKLSEVRPELPPMIEQVAERCLEKDPDLRYQSAADLRGELKRLKRESGASSSATLVPPATHAGRPGWLWPALAAAAVAVAGGAWWGLRPRPPAAPLQLQFRQLTFNGNVVDAVISPDGKFLAYVATGAQGTALHLRAISSGSDVEIMPPTAGCCQSPSFSPDGGQVYFLEANILKAIPVLGGAVRTIATRACTGAGVSPDGSQIAYVANPNVLTLARPDGSQAHMLTQAETGSGYLGQCWIESSNHPSHSPAWSPDGRWIAVAAFPVSGEGHLTLVNAADGHSRVLGPGMNLNSADMVWQADGQGLVFSASIPDDAPPQVWQISYPAGQVTQLTNDLQGYGEASLSNGGQLVVVHSAPQGSVWVQSRAGGEFQQLPGGGTNQEGRGGLAWTPQGGLITTRFAGRTHQLWTESSEGSNASIVPAENLPANTNHPVVAPDGTLVFGDGGSTSNLWRVNGDGTGLQPLLQLAAGADAFTPNLVRGGREVSYMYVDAKGSQTLWTVPLAGGAPQQAWGGQVLAGSGQAVSPDGTRLFAIVRAPTASGREGMIIRLDGGQPQATPLTALDFSTGSPPLGWTPDGRALTYRVHRGTTDNIWALPIAGGAAYPLTHFNDLNISAYAFSKDGRLAVSRGSQNSDAVVATGLGGKQR